MLDLENPRHERAQTQREALEALIADQGTKLVTLACDVSEFGLSPIDRMLVIRNPGKKTYTVIEGNRRLAAVKLLRNPDLAEGTELKKDLAKLEVGEAPASIDCVVAGSRDEACHWQELRHTAGGAGAQTIVWNTMASTRFRGVPGSQASRAVAFVDAVQSAFPKNAELQDTLAKVANERLTTLGRVVADPEFRKLVGVEEGEHGLIFHFPAEVLEPLIEKLFDDLAGEYSVTQLKTKEQRVAYIGGFGPPDPSRYTVDAKPLIPSKAPTAPMKKAPPKKVPTPPPLFKDVTVAALGDRVEAILVETRRLDPARYPNAAGVLVRAVLELSVDSFLTIKKQQTNGELKTRVRRACTSRRSNRQGRDVSRCARRLERWHKCDGSRDVAWLCSQRQLPSSCG